jgi:hypothetical protein
LASARAGAIKIELLDSASEIVRSRLEHCPSLAGIQPAKPADVNLNIEVSLAAAVLR